MQKLQKLQQSISQRSTIKSYWETKQITSLNQYYQLAIIGAGFQGMWLAYFALKDNPSLSIAIFEKDQFALGASTRNAGFLTCSNISQIYSDIKQLGLQQVKKLTLKRLEGCKIVKQQFPDSCCNNRGSYDYDLITPQKTKFIQKGYNPPFQIRKGKLGNGSIQDYYFNKQDASVNPARLLKLLRNKVLSYENVVFLNKNVINIGKGIITIQNYQYNYKHAYVCVNSYKNILLPTGIKIAPGRGQIIVTSPINKSEIAMGYYNQGYDYWRFLDDKRLLIGGGRHLFLKQQNTNSFDISQSRIKQYLKQLAIKIIGHQQFTIDYHWSGIMGFIDGGHCGTHIQQIDQKTHSLFACGGMGVALTPYLSKKVAKNIFPR